MNAEGQLGDGSTNPSLVPLMVGTGYATAAGGWAHTVAMRADGLLLAWGRNAAGQLGIGTFASRTSPALVVNNNADGFLDLMPGTPKSVVPPAAISPVLVLSLLGSTLDAGIRFGGDAGAVQAVFFYGLLQTNSRLLGGEVVAGLQALATGEIPVCIVSRSSAKQKQGNSCPPFVDPPNQTGNNYEVIDVPKFDPKNESGVICSSYATSAKGLPGSRIVAGSGHSINMACPEIGIRDGMAAAQPYPLNIVNGGTGGGVVTSGDGLVNCRGCTATYTRGSTVTLFAAASSGSTFSGWSGACSGSGPCTVTMTSPVDVIARFAPNTPTPPAAPRGVSVVPGFQSATVAFLPPLADGGSPITGYTARCTDSASTFTNSGSASPIVVTGLTNGYRYTCSASASNSVGSSQASLSSSGFIAASVPGAPTLTRLISGNNTLTAYFDPPASNGGARIDSYVVSCTGGGVTRTASYAASPIVVSGLTNQTKYSCSVHAHNGSGNGAESPALLRAAGRRSIAPLLGVILGE